jgi:ABC-type enterochelin transport system permease subunit
MGILLQPWSLLLFAVVMFFVFLTIGAKEDYKAEVLMTPLIRWMIVGICVVIATFGVFKVQQDRNWHPFQSGTEVAPTTVR